MIRYNFIATVIQVTVSALLGYQLIASHGLAGAAWAQVGSYFVTLIVVVIFTFRCLRIHFRNER